MCLVIDTNCFGSVLNPKAEDHDRFAPVYHWLMYGRGGRLIYGGEKYKKEVDFRTSHHRTLIQEIERKGRLLRVDDAAVDREAKAVRMRANNDADFDDEHIVALVIVSRCCVVCTLDKRAYPYIKNRHLYPAPAKPPKIYQSKRNKKLCGDPHIAEICQDTKR
jgi:hypothetical protein